MEKTRFLVRLVVIGWAAAFVMLSMPAASAAAPLAVAGPGASQFTLNFNNRMRGEFVDWFEAGPPADNSDYAFIANRTQLGVGGKWQWLGGFLQYQHTVLSGIPHRGVGVGGNYRGQTNSDFQEQGWLRQGWLQAELAGGPVRATAQGGRFRYLDGTEISSKDPSLDWLRKARIAERLIGPFDFTHIGRSFDGGRVALDTENINLTGFYLIPTSGGFEISAGRHMGIDLGGLSLAWKDSERFPGLQARTFWIHYDDGRPADRDVVAVDNRPAAVRGADRGRIRVETFGADMIRVQSVGPGIWDSLAWAAAQTGDWQALHQNSWAYAVETGYKLPDVPWTPWLRLAFFRSSGDDDPGDGRHGTFFQLLPTARLYAFTPFYNLMNTQDLMLQLLAKPFGVLSTRLDLHWLRVTEGRDLLYAGGGATKRDSFGFGGTPAAGAREVAYVVAWTVGYALSGNVDLQAYVSHAFGQAAVRNGFPRDHDLTYGFLEATLSF